MEKINIVSSSRSGSSYLFSLIMSGITNSNFEHCYAEPFGDNTNKTTWSNIVDLTTSPNYSVLLKNHYFQLENLYTTNIELFTKFFTVKWKNILIIRKNIFEQALSLALARTTKSYVPYSNNNVKILVNQKLFDKSLKDCIDRNNNITENKLKINYFKTIFYEDLVINPIDVVNELDLKNIKLDKICPNKELLMQDKKNVVKNYDALQKHAHSLINAQKV